MVLKGFHNFFGRHQAPPPLPRRNLVLTYICTAQPNILFIDGAFRPLERKLDQSKAQLCPDGIHGA